MRRFWRGDGGVVSELATRLSGSSDLYEQSGRRPYASINFVTAHDGFTLNDLVSYNDKHNDANGEENRDGENHNLSWNRGVEGPTNDPRDQRAARPPAAQLPRDADDVGRRADDQRRRRDRPHAARQQQRATARTTRPAGRTGTSRRNSATCSTSSRRLIRIWKQNPVLRRRKFLQGRRIRGADVTDITWLDTVGRRDDRRGVERAGRAHPRACD